MRTWVQARALLWTCLFTWEPVTPLPPNTCSPEGNLPAVKENSLYN